MYEEIPHLLTPVVVDPKLAANALRWAVHEMEERYKTLAAVGVRNIEQYNRNLKLAQVENKGPVLDDHGNEVRTLPFIVVLIDELADLMMVASNEVEESICRLAQMARAVGIHLILATQRPSVDVITGLIKANLPARISFRVSSKIDSRTILDGNGAEQLLGKGDMLYLPPASSRFVRLHGPYISEQESARLASFLRKQGKPTYDTTITEDDKKTGGDARVREGRPVRRSGADRRLERPGVDFVSAAPAADRVQPRRAAGRHDGSRRARLGRVGRGRRQVARGAREAGLLRRSGRATEVANDSQAWCGAARDRLRSRRPSALAAGGQPPRDAVRARHGTGARAAGGGAAADAASSCGAPSARTMPSSAGFPASGYSDNALWQAGNLAAARVRAFRRSRPTAALATRLLLRGSRSSIRRSSLVRRVDEALVRLRTRLPPAAAAHRALTPRLAVEASPAARDRDGRRRTQRLRREPGATAPAAGADPRHQADGASRRHARHDRNRCGSAFRAERLENPRRVFFDLKGTRPVPALQDATLRVRRRHRARGPARPASAEHDAHRLRHGGRRQLQRVHALQSVSGS